MMHDEYEEDLDPIVDNWINGNRTDAVKQAFELPEGSLFRLGCKMARMPMRARGYSPIHRQDLWDFAYLLSKARDGV